MWTWPLTISLIVLGSLITIQSFPTEASKLLRVRDVNQVPEGLSHDPEDGDWVKNYAAIGDSFSAAIGAGTVLTGAGDAGCSRYDGSFAEHINDYLGPSPRNYQFVACSGDTSSQVRDQIKSIGVNSQDLVTLTAGGNDVGFEDVLKKCVYLPYPESACNNALSATQDLIDKSLEGNIDALLDDLNKAMKANGIAVYVLYAKFFNQDTDACDDQTWTYIDPSGSSGLKMTKARRKQMNDMVDSSNQKIRNAITTFHGRTDTPKMELVTAEWDNFMGATQGRFCEDGASLDPKNDTGLAFQRLDNTPYYIPEYKEKVDDPRRRAITLPTREHDDGSMHVEARAPDNIGRVFHPSPFGQSVIATFVWYAIAQVRNKALSGVDRILHIGVTDCSHNAGTDLLPGEEAKDTTGNAIVPLCGTCSDLYTSPSDIGNVIQTYCANSGKKLFLGDTPSQSTKDGGQSSHILTQGISIKDQGNNYYQNSTACQAFNERINTDDCIFALKTINSTCNPQFNPSVGYCPGTYTYKCTSWGISTNP